MTIPYTYLLRFILTGQLYYGVRYREECHPDELFVTYFSSSKIVAKLLAEYGPEAFEFSVRQTFATKKQARDWEQRLLTKVNAAANPKFLNQSNNMKGVLRGVGLYAWYYNPKTCEKLLMKNSSPTPIGFIKGKRGADLKQKNTVIATNMSTGKFLRLGPFDIIPEGYELGRKSIDGSKKGTTENTLWICNDATRETKLIAANTNIPDGWRAGNLHIKNKGRVKIHKNTVTISIYPEQLAQYIHAGWQLGIALSNNVWAYKQVDGQIYSIYISPDQIDKALADGYKLGKPQCGHVKIFNIDNTGEIVVKRVTSEQATVMENEGWYRGNPTLFRITFTNGDIMTYPYQWFVRNMGIPKAMIYSSYASHGQSPKYNYTSVEKLS